MAQQTMYDGAVNSPITTITNSISSTDTTIYVLDDTKIPDAPNLLVIGGNLQGAETVLMTAKNGDELTVQRGFQGSAVAWNSGATIARNFTEYDYRVLKENIEDLDGREALDLPYDNTASGLTATNAQAAIDEVDGDLDAHKAETVSQGPHGMGSAASLDFEEGLWTPAFSLAGITYTSYGRYFKFGNYAWILGHINVTANDGASAASSIQISGLPFVPVGTINDRVSLIFENESAFVLAAGFTRSKAVPNIGTSNMFLFKEGSSRTQISKGEITVGLISFSGWYRI